MSRIFIPSIMFVFIDLKCRIFTYFYKFLLTKHNYLL